MKLLIISFMFFALGALFIICNERLALHDPDARDIFGHKYFLWLSSLFSNGAKITGYVVHSDWLPTASENNVSAGR